jgi:PleD family two-component response regulator
VAGHVTVSVGIARLKPRLDTATDLLLRVADEALDEAKAAGPERVAARPGWAASATAAVRFGKPSGAGV